MSYILKNKQEKKYITYKRPWEEELSKRGAVVQTENKKEAYIFPSKKKAKSEKHRLSKKARNYEIVEVAEKEVKKNKTSVPPTAKRKQFSNNTRKEIYRKTKGCCYLCGDFVDFDEFEVDHKIPIASGGTNDIDNLFCACHLCNSLKQSFPYEEVLKAAKKIAKNHADEIK